MKIENYRVVQKINSDYFENIIFCLDWTAMKYCKFWLNASGWLMKQYHKIIQVERNLWRSSGPTHLVKSRLISNIGQDVHSFVESSFEYFRAQGLHTLSEKAARSTAITVNKCFSQGNCNSGLLPNVLSLCTFKKKIILSCLQPLIGSCNPF